MRGKIGYISVALGLALLGVAGALGQVAGANSASLTPHAPAAMGDWPMYGHDISRTNYNPDETTISAGNVAQLVQRWQANIGSNGTPSSSAPVVSNGRVYVGSSAASPASNYFAFDAVTGAQAWAENIGYRSSCLNVGIGSTAAISGTTLVVGEDNAQSNPAYHGISTIDGSKVWTNTMNVGTSGFPWESPLLDNGRAYLGMASRCDNPSIRGEVRAVDLSTGATINSAYFVNAGGAGGGIWNSPAMSPDHSTLVIGTGEDYSCTDCSLTRSMVSLDALTLAVLQHHQEPSPNQDLDFGTTPVIFHDSQNRTLVGAGHKNGIFYTYDISNINVGAIWTRSNGGTSVGLMPAYDPSFGSGGTLFIVNGSITAVDPGTGAVRWGPVTIPAAHGNIAIANGLLFVNGGSSGLQIRSETDGSLLRTLTPPSAGASNSGVAVANGFVYWVSGSDINAWSVPVVPTPTATSTPTATATPVPRRLIGHVSWEGRPAQPSALQQLPITLTLHLGSATYNYPNQTTDASGFFTVSVTTLPTGVYTWWAKGPQYLATTGSVSLSGSPSTAQEMGVQPAGDANNDNLVDVSDFSLLRATFGLACGNPVYDGRADFTGDCVVDVSDFSLLRAHFGQTGPPQPAGPSAALTDDR